MRLKKIQELFKNKLVVRVTAGVLCVALLGGSFGIYKMSGGTEATTANAAIEKESPAAASKKKADSGDQDSKEDKENDLSSKMLSLFSGDSKEKEKESLDAKEETVYLITDANGNISKTIVSNWLKNGSKSEKIKDVSTLSDIENVKGDEAFTKDGDNITWDAAGKDIYYQGTTAKEVPISEKVTYYLDGVETAPQDLAGKSGRITIRFDYTNHEKTTVKIDGKKEKIFVPFTVMSGMVLDESFQNIQVNNGKVLSDGNKNVVVGFAMPGLRKNLGVDEKDFEEGFEFPEFVEISADAEDFSLDMTATVAMTGLLSDTDIAANMDLSELDKSMESMTDAMGKLKDGGGELAEGLDTLQSNMSGFKSGVGSLKDGVDAYTDGAAKLADGLKTLHDSSGTLETGADTLNSSAKTIRDGVKKLDQTLNAEMTDEEKAAAKKEVSKTIGEQFKEGTDTYKMIYQAATKNFTETMTSDATVSTVQSGIQGGLKSQGLKSKGVIQALAEYYAAHGFTDASGKSYSAEICQSNVPGQEVTYAAFFANAVLSGGLSSALANGITSGIAAQGAPAVGESVVSACKSAAELAGGTAAISGAESAKKQIASAIEAKDEASGHSLVSGTQVLYAGTQKLAENVPALKSGIGQLLSGANTLVGSNETLKDGVAQLADGTAQIDDGVMQLNEGAHTLSDGLNEFDEKAVSEITDAYQGDVKVLVERLKAIAQAGEDYGTFSGAAEGVDVASKLIFRTDAVTK